jgi:flavin reductase (DIM6/NTAB) family NADH-FMN oxidoreductase RutF
MLEVFVASHFSLSESDMSPSAAALVTFRSGGEEPCFIPALWVGVTWGQPATLIFAFRAAGSFPLDILDDVDFAVHLPPSRQRPFRDLLPGGRRGADRLSEAGYTLAEGAGVPLIAECGHRLLCRGARPAILFEQVIVRGEVAAIQRTETGGAEEDSADIFGTPFFRPIPRSVR